MGMCILFCRLYNAAEAGTDSACHSLFEGNECCPVSGELLYCPEHGHRSACTDAVEFNSVLPYGIENVSLGSDTAVFGSDICVRILFELIKQESVAVSVSHDRDNLYACCRQFLGKLEHRGNSDTSSEKKCSDRCVGISECFDSFNIVSVSENSENGYIITLFKM